MPNEFTNPSSGQNAPTRTTSSSDVSILSPGAPASFADLKDKVGEDVSAAKATIKEGADTAINKVRETVSEQTNFAARQVGGVAAALEKVGAELEGSEQAEIGRYARQIGRSAQSIARQMEGKDVGEIATMAEDFGRRQPLAFLGIAALAGLTASRFLTASSKRKATSASPGTSGAAASRSAASPSKDWRNDQ
jgi:hypothetical protein